MSGEDTQHLTDFEMGPAPMPCPACHHPDHDPGSCPECPSCELHVDEALIWVSRVSREDYDEFVEAIEADAIQAALTDLIPKLHRSLRGRGLALWEIEDAIRAALNDPDHPAIAALPDEPVGGPE